MAQPVKYSGPEFNPSSPIKCQYMSVCVCNPNTGEAEAEKNPLTHWPASLVYMVSSSKEYLFFQRT